MPWLMPLNSAGIWKGCKPLARVLGYIPGKSVIHGIHPLTKLIWLVGSLVFSMILGLKGLAVGVMVVLLLAWYAGVLKPS